MPARVFQRDEHEFLRICAMAVPHWASLRAMGATQLDWNYLRQTALAHQLDGVLAWRLVAPELDGAVPSTVRNDCEAYLGYLDGMPRQRYSDDLAVATEVFASTDVRWVVHGGPLPYRVYGEFWPRVFDNVDVFVAASDWERGLDSTRRFDGFHPVSDQLYFHGELGYVPLVV